MYRPLVSSALRTTCSALLPTTWASSTSPGARLGTALCLGIVSCGLAWPESAAAEALDRWYAGAGIGWGYAEPLEFADGAEMDLDRGTDQLLGVVGRRIGDDWRIEVDYTAFERSPELLYSSSAGIEVDTDEGDLVSSSSVMLNVVRDLRIGQAWRPYLGIGVGRGDVEVEFAEPAVAGPFLQPPRRPIIDDKDSGFAWQVMAGVTVPLTSRLELAADFRYWQLPGADLQDLSGAETETDHTVRSAWLHLRYHGSNAGVFAGPAPRQAPESGWYVSGSVGGGFPQDEDVEDTTLVIDAYDLGTTATIAAGYHLRPRWRVELEASFWDNGVEVMEFSKDFGEDRATGSVESLSLMLNVIHQFAPGSSIRPFVGLGAGWIRSSYDISTAGFCRNFVCDPVEQRADLIDDHGTAGAAQAMVGVDVAISERLRFSAAYRQLITGTTEMEAVDGSPFDIEKRYVTSITAGFRYALGR